jgi:hypothetical protein
MRFIRVLVNSTAKLRVSDRDRSASGMSPMNWST